MPRRRKVVIDESEIMSRNNTKIVRSWSTTQFHSEELERIARKIKTASGAHCDKSKVINALIDLLVENENNLKVSEIFDTATLKTELIRAIKNAPNGRY